MLRLRNFIFFILIIIMMNGCGNGDEKNDDKTAAGRNEDLIVKDESGTRVNLQLKPVKGDNLNYKMVAVTTSKEKGPQTGDREVTTNQTINYFYSEEVYDITDANIITYKVKFDSIVIHSDIASGDSTVQITYNSNVHDTVYSMPEFLQYNSIMGEEFFMRVNSYGEITEVYGMEKVYENMFKLLGDTLNQEQKSAVRESFSSESIKPVLQQQFQMFPQHEVLLDSAWTRSYETSLMVFPVKNLLNYKLTDIKEENNETIVTIEGGMSIEFIDKEFKESQVTYRIEDVTTGGSGKVIFNLTKGTIVSKETQTNIDMKLRLSAGGQSANATQTLTTRLKVEQY
jgi:hypothetical protein